MGANNSKLDYEYGDPAYNYYARARARGMARGPPFYGQPMPMQPAGYPVITPPIVYPLAMQPGQQIPGLPVGQMPQPALQAQQPAIQVPQPAGGGVMPPNPMLGPQMPQFQGQPISQPQPQVPLSTGFHQGQWLNPPPLTRSPSSSGSSTSSRRRRRRRRRRQREREREDPFAHNPLPRAPREAEVPDGILAGSAVTPRGPPLPRSSSPLRNPLPPPPRDVYRLKRYRPLLIGTAYADMKKDVYPRGWFDDDDRQDSDSGLGRVFERLNPFRSRSESGFSPGHRRNETMPELPRMPEFVRESSGSDSESNAVSPRPRRPGFGRSFSSRLPFARRRRAAEAENILSRVVEGEEPPPGFMRVPSPAVPGPTEHPQPAHPLSPVPSQPAPAHPLSPDFPGQQGVIPPGAMLHPGNPLSPRPPGTPMIPRSPRPGQPQPVNPLSPGPAPTMGMPTPAQAPAMGMPTPGPAPAMGMPTPGPGPAMNMPTPSPGPPMNMPMPGAPEPMGMPAPGTPYHSRFAPGAPEPMGMPAPGTPHPSRFAPGAPEPMGMPAPGTPHPSRFAPGTPYPTTMPTPGLQPMGMPAPGDGAPVGMPTPARPLSPAMPPVVAGQGPGLPRSMSMSNATLPVIRFDQNTPGYGDLTHTAPRRVLYRRKLYPTAAHLFEAFRFLDFRDDIAKRVRKAETLGELEAVLRETMTFSRPDWEQVLFDKMEDALYHRIVQHEDLCDMLLNTGNAELIYADPNDSFWGEGAHEEGANELGRALMRVRDRLRSEDNRH